jgi:hypothetical protein
VAALSVSDLVLAARLVRKQPVLSLTAVLALATGIGLATPGFTFLVAASALGCHLWAAIAS